MSSQCRGGAPGDATLRAGCREPKAFHPSRSEVTRQARDDSSHRPALFTGTSRRISIRSTLRRFTLCRLSPCRGGSRRSRPLISPCLSRSVIDGWLYVSSTRLRGRLRGAVGPRRTAPRRDGHRPSQARRAPESRRSSHSRGGSVRSRRSLFDTSRCVGTGPSGCGGSAASMIPFLPVESALASSGPPGQYMSLSPNASAPTLTSDSSPTAGKAPSTSMDSPTPNHPSGINSVTTATIGYASPGRFVLSRRLSRRPPRGTIEAHSSSQKRLPAGAIRIR